jgi:hypothetical protein
LKLQTILFFLPGDSGAAGFYGTPSSLAIPQACSRQPPLASRAGSSKAKVMAALMRDRRFGNLASLIKIIALRYNQFFPSLQVLISVRLTPQASIAGCCSSN